MAWLPIQEQLSANLTVPASVFSVSHDPRDATFLLFVNGVTQTQTVDYTLSGTVVTTTSVIPSGWNVYSSYFYSDGTPVNGDTFLQCDEYESIIPAGHYGSTTLNHVISSFEKLADRIKYQLGWPATRIEICDDQIYDFINQACEWYSKYAGTTEEYVIFNSNIYTQGIGIRMDEIFTRINSYYTTGQAARTNAAVSAQFVDCDLNDYRKVVDVFNVEPVENTGTDTLFTMDYLFAQQTYFSYLLGSFGFDLITWHILKDWLDLRSKLFATKPYIRFDPRTQYLKIMPEPVNGNGFVGVVGCHVERPIRDLVRERWVQRYALALTKIALAHIRGKFGQVTLFGGATLNAQDLMTQGTAEQKMLEEELMNNFGEVTPPLFYVG